MKGSPGHEAVAPTASAPSLGAGAASGTQGAGRRDQQPAAPAEDFSDIEAILKKHGI